MAMDEDRVSGEQDTTVDMHSHDERTWAALAHACTLLNFVAGLGGLIGAAVIWFAKKEESDWVAFHGLQSLAFQATQFVVTLIVVGGTWILGFAFSFLTLGLGTLIAVPLMFVTFFLGILIMVGGLVYSLYGAYRVYEGQAFRYLWLGDWVAKHSGEAERVETQEAGVSDSRSRNVLLIAAIVAAALILCVLCVAAVVVAAGVLGGVVYWNSSAFMPTLFSLV
jgi:uncharacterized Tic20 family protein